MKCMFSPGPSRSVFSERYLVLVQPGLSRRSLISQNFLVMFLNFSKYLVLVLTAKKLLSVMSISRFFVAVLIC